MKVWIKCSVILFMFYGCQKRAISDRYPYHRGFATIYWGAPSAAVDSLIHSDSTFKTISKVGNSKTRGLIVVLQQENRDYYLEFNDRDQFFSMNYIAEKDYKGALDSARILVERNYGPPDRIDDNGATYQNHIWNVMADSLSLEVQLLVTAKSYSLRVTNKDLAKKK